MIYPTNNTSMIKKTFHGLVCVLIVLLFIQCSSEPEIAQWRGPNRDGVYPENGLLKKWPTDGPELLWKFEDLGIGHSSAAVISDKVYTSGTLEDSITYVFAFNIDGELLWKKPLGKEWMTSFPGTHSTPLIYDEYGYQMTSLGVIYCFSSETGDIIWKRDLLSEFDGKNIMHGMTENLLIDGAKIFCTPGGEKSNVLALNRFSGELIWESSANGQISSDCSPIIINHASKKYFITLTANSVIALDSDNGDFIWSHPLTYEWKFHASTPIYNDGKLFVIDGFENGSPMLEIAEDGKSVKEIWKDYHIEDYLGDAVLLNGYLYGGTRHYDSSWYCLDWNTGELMYSSRMIEAGSIIAADGLLYCYAFNGELALIEPSPNGFKKRSSFQIGSKRPDHWAPVVIKDGRMYVRYSKSLFVYNIKK